MKRPLLMILTLSLVVSLLSGIRPAPVQAATIHLADYFPANTAAYGELDTSNLPATLNMVAGLVSQIVPGIPPNWETLVAAAYEQSAKRKVDFEKDLLGWVGDRVAFGVVLPDNKTLTTILQGATGDSASQPQIAALFTVKDEAKLDAIIKDLSTPSQFPASAAVSTETIGGQTVTLWSTNNQPQLARWSGFLALGNVRAVLDLIKNKTTPLSADSLYQKMSATLNPATLGSVFVRTPLSLANVGLTVGTLSLLGPAINNVFQNVIRGLQDTTPQPTPSPTPTPVPSPDLPRLISTLLNLGGSIYSVRAQDKALTLDVSFNYDSSNVQTLGSVLNVDLAPVVAAPKNVSGSLLAAIPADASLVLLGSDIPQIYDSTTRSLAAVVNTINLAGSGQLNPGNTLSNLTGQVQSSLQTTLGLDLNKDVLGWMGGDYAAFVTPDQGGLLDTFSQGQLPVAENILIASSDTTASQKFSSAIVSLLSKQLNSTPATPDASGLYNLTVAPGLGLKLGMVGNNFALSTATNFSMTPANPLSSSPAWQNAAKLLPKAYSQVFFADADKLNGLIAHLSSASQSDSTKSQLAQISALLKPFESGLVIYSQTQAGTGTSSFVLIEK